MIGGNDLPAYLSAPCTSLTTSACGQRLLSINLMGASVAAGLVRGCMDAVTTEGATESTITIANEAVRRLAKLSPRQLSRIQGILQSAMLDVQLELALKHDILAAAYLLIRSLSNGQSRCRLLRANSPLVSKCYTCVLKEIEASQKKDSGEIKVLLRALTWLIRSVVVAKTKVLSDAATTLASTQMKYSGNDKTETKPVTSYSDPVILLALSSSLLLCSVVVLNGDQGVDDEVKWTMLGRISLKLLLVSFNPQSLTADVLLSRIAVLLHSHEITLLHDMVQEAHSSKDINVDDDDRRYRCCRQPLQSPAEGNLGRFGQSPQWDGKWNRPKLNVYRKGLFATSERPALFMHVS